MAGGLREVRISKMPNSQQPTDQTLVIFAGDSQDRIVHAALANLIQQKVTLQTFDWPEGANLPDRLLGEISALETPARLVLHRNGLGPKEIGILSQLRESAGVVRKKWTIELIVGDLVRYADLQIVSTLVDRIVPESIAADLLAGHPISTSLNRHPRASSPIGILSANEALSNTLKDILLEWGYEPRCLRGWSDPAIPAGALLIWDVPMLSDRWEIRLRDQSRVRPILALLGFADRTTVNRAREAGAVACLDLPFDLEDLEKVLTRFAVQTQVPGHMESPSRKITPSNREIGDTSSHVRLDSGHSLRDGLTSARNRTGKSAGYERSGRAGDSSETAD